jgi:hypothetical protein
MTLPEIIESPSTGTQPPPAPLTTIPFSHKPPFEMAFAERVPLLQAFNLAIHNYLRLRAEAGRSLACRVERRLQPQKFAFHAVECGVFTGSSLLACAELARDAHLDFRLVGLDTFAGLPPLSETDLSLARPKARYLRQAMFTETSVEEVRRQIREARFEREVEVHEGLFSETLPLLPEQRYHFVNIDCDLYEPHIECLDYFYPRMMPGAIVFFDDYHSIEYPMAGKAVDDWMQGRPEQLMHLRFGDDAPNRTKSFFIKY